MGKSTASFLKRQQTMNRVFVSTSGSISNKKRWESAGIVLPFLAIYLLNVYVAYHYLGFAGALLYTVVFGFLSVFAWKYPLDQGKWSKLLYLLVFLSLAAQILALHLLGPRFDSRMDRDDAILFWLQALRAGVFPYSVPTGLGNPISILPAMPLIGLPFILLGNVGYLPVFSFLVLVLLLWKYYQGSSRIRFFIIAALSCAPLVFMEVVGKSDLMVNVVLVLLPVFLLEAFADHRSHHRAILLGIVFGLLIATRFAIYPVLLAYGVFIVKKFSFRWSVEIGVCGFVLAVLLIAPFVIWSPEIFLHYAPLGVNSTKLGSNQFVQIVWITITLIASVGTGLLGKTPRSLFRGITMILLVEVCATWFSFFQDLTYLQLILIPAAFSFPYLIKHE
jgi:hypothetical protein